MSAGSEQFRCVECGRAFESEVEAHGWRAYLVPELKDDDEPEDFAVYCPECAEREFG